MDIQTQQEQLEIILRGIRLATQFKTFLLTLDIQSRRFILDYSKRWFELECKKDNNDINNKLFNWFQNAYNIYLNDDEQLKKMQITNTFIWDDLYGNMSYALPFQKLVGFCMYGKLPQDDLR